MNRSGLRVALALLTGALASLGLPGIDFAPLFLAGVVALALLVMASGTLGGSLLVGLFWSVGLFPGLALGTLSWGTHVPFVYAVLGTFYYALPIVLLVLAVGRRLAPAQLFLVVASAWSLWMELGDLIEFPWKGDLLSLVGVTPWLLGGARLVGGNTLSGITMAGCIACAVRWHRGNHEPKARRIGQALAPPATSAGVLSALAIVAWLAAPGPIGNANVGIVQPNVGPSFYQSRLIAPHLVAEFDRRIDQLLSELSNTELVVMTESFDGRYSLALAPMRERWQERARASRQAILLTSYLVEPDGFKSNAVGGIAPGGAVVGIHKKVDLAPFGETPLAAGSDFRVIDVLEKASVGAFICQESCLPRASRTLTRSGAKLLVATTSDVTFGSSVLIFQHIAITRLRAIETGRSIVWASNGGPSGVIDRWGKLLDAGPFREPAAVHTSAALYEDRTPYLRWPWATPSLAAIALGALVLRRRQRTAVRPNTSHVGPVGITHVAVLWTASLALAPAIWIGTPGLVELLHGHSARAISAIHEALTTGSNGPQVAGGLARFRTSHEQSAAGAISYFLAYYGVEEPTHRIAETLTSSGSLQDLQFYLREQLHIATRAIPLEPSLLPRTAALVRLHDGSYAVLTNPFADAQTNMFVPETGNNVPVQTSTILTLAEPVGLIPQSQ